MTTIIRTPQELLTRLFITTYTKRHLQIVNDFLEKKLYKDEDIKAILSQLGTWSDKDVLSVGQFLFMDNGFPCQNNVA